MRRVEDVYKAAEYAEGLGHYIRVAIVRLLEKYGDMLIIDIIAKLEEVYNIRTSYANILAHVRKLVLTGICEEKKINNAKALHLLVRVEVCYVGEENGKGSN